MTTPELRELAGVSLVNNPVLPAESKHDSDMNFKRHKETLWDNMAMMKWENELKLYNKGKELRNVLWDPRYSIRQEINKWNFRYMTNEEAMHVPLAA